MRVEKRRVDNNRLEVCLHGGVYGRMYSMKVGGRKLVSGEYESGRVILPMWRELLSTGTLPSISHSIERKQTTRPVTATSKAITMTYAWRQRAPLSRPLIW